MRANPERNAQIVQLRESGVGPREIARQLGVSACVVAGVLHRAGLSKKPSGRGHASEPAFREAVLVTADRIGPRRAARAWGVSHKTVYHWRAA